MLQIILTSSFRRNLLDLINVDTRLLGYFRGPSVLKNGLREYKHPKGLTLPKPDILHGDIQLLARKVKGVTLEELTTLDQKRKVGLFLKDKLKGVPLDAFEERILNLLIQEDAEYHLSRKAPTNLKNIEEHGQRFRVQFKEGGKIRKASFNSLEEAIRFRDRQYEKHQ